MKPDLNNLLKVLLENQVDFVLIGGYAATLHGSSIVTKDLDICAVLTSSQVEKLRKVLAPFEPKHRMTPQKLSFLTEPRDLRNLDNLYLETQLGILDVITSVTGVGDYSAIASRCVEVPLFGRQCKVISIEDLIAAKEKMGREKDKIAARELRIILSKMKGK